MINTILGLKKEMSARFDQHGRCIPVTIIVAEPNIILAIRDNKAQLGFGQKKKVKKPQNDYVKIAGFAPRFVREVKIIPENQSAGPLSTGEKVAVSIFEPGDIVKVTGTTKGRGFTGGVKRWGFAGGPKTHGQSDRHRAPGSIGQTTTPGRVFRGKKMAGHMGASKHTVGGLEVINVDDENNLISVKGSVPGAKNGLLIIEKTGQVAREETEDAKKSETKGPEEPKEPQVVTEGSKDKKEEGAKENAKT